MCGNCCSGSSGTVRFTEDEAERMALKLKVSLPDFYQLYTRKQGRGANAWRELKEVKVEGKRGWYDCVFLDRVSVPGKALCKLYEERPTQCKTWPFWPDILETPKSWELAGKGAEGCAGIGKGELISYDDIVSQRDNPGLGAT